MTVLVVDEDVVEYMEADSLEEFEGELHVVVTRKSASEWTQPIR